MNDRQRHTRLRELLAPGAAVMIPGAANGLTAQLVDQVGFDTFIVPGAAIANFSLGVPDLGFVTATELVGHLALVRDVVDLPIIVDADTGFGGPLNVYRTVRLLERAGVNGIMIEDQVSPKRCGHFSGKEVIPKAEMVQKLRAALDARSDPGLVVIARTDARAVHGLEDALDRAAAYRDAGADVLFVESPLSADELEQIPKAVPGPHLCNMVFGGRTPIMGREDLGALGYAGVFVANAVIHAAMRSMLNVLQHLKDKGTLAGAEDQMVSFAERQSLVGMEFFEKLADRYRSDSDHQPLQGRP